MLLSEIVVGALIIFFVVFIAWDLVGGDLDKKKFGKKK
jgi:hypothetical protein